MADSKAMFQILRIFAEFEPSIIQERVRADLARATETAVRATLANGTGVMKAAKMHGDGVVHRDAHLPSTSVKAPVSRLHASALINARTATMRSWRD